MQENLLNKKDSNSKVAEKYIDKYLNDLQNHFNLSDTHLVNILNNCISSLKRKEVKKKWWHFK